MLKAIESRNDSDNSKRGMSNLLGKIGFLTLVTVHLILVLGESLAVKRFSLKQQKRTS